jgi:hypothetical protein
LFAQAVEVADDAAGAQLGRQGQHGIRRP